ncbi:MAG TPA: hypothetical protein VJG65_02195 [Patescibacteria group bacterium]|nr:hypothetical protein [Patescibacteria group bacterium]
MAGQKFTLPNDIAYADNVGNILRGLLNGVKQTAQSFAAIHDLDAEYLEMVMQGQRPITSKIIQAVESHPPLNARDLLTPNRRWEIPVNDDTTDGVVICPPEKMMATKRRFHRGPAGNKVPFYDYADTAMSKTSPFRPEWIAELYVNEGANPFSMPHWAFNNGHFEFQMTYFIGQVNFHWIDKLGEKHVCQMNTGDMNFITPFVPHTFTTRVQDGGLILAVTYGGAISTPEFQAEIQQLSLQEFLDKYLAQIADRSHIVSQTINQSACREITALGGIIIKRYQDAKTRCVPFPGTKELISGIPFQPYTQAFEHNVAPRGSQTAFQNESEIWGYVTGELPIQLKWADHSETMNQNTSFFIKPKTPHLPQSALNRPAQMITMEIKPGAGNPIDELGMIHEFTGIAGLQRVHSETKQWF